MHLIALAVLMCNVQTGDCDWYVPAIYKSQTDCDTAAVVFARNPTIFPLPRGRTAEIIDCRPASGRPRRK